MKDYVRVVIYVDKITVHGKHINKNKNKIKEFDSDYELNFNVPISFYSPYVKVVELGQEEEFITSIKEKVDEKIYKNEKWFDKKIGRNYTIESIDVDFSVTTKKASEQSVNWCMEYLTVSQMLDMGISIIEKVD